MVGSYTWLIEQMYPKADSFNKIMSMIVLVKNHSTVHILI